MKSNRNQNDLITNENTLKTHMQGQEIMTVMDSGSLLNFEQVHHV